MPPVGLYKLDVTYFKTIVLKIIKKFQYFEFVTIVCLSLGSEMTVVYMSLS